MKSLCRCLFLLAIEWTMAGCAATPTTPGGDRLATTPVDFSIDLTVLAPPGSAETATTDRMQAKYVLFANGNLHYAPDPAHLNGANWLPPLMRTLSRQQVAEVWSLTNQLGFYRDAQRNDVANFKLAAPAGVNEVAFLVAFVAEGHRWSIERRSPTSQPDPALNELTNHLARLAWAEEEHAGAVHMQPVRYDFGADPYLPYRAAGGTP